MEEGITGPRPLLWRAVAAVLAVVALAGCMRSDVEVTVTADGGGTVVVEAYPDRPTAETMRAFDVAAQVDALGDRADVQVERVDLFGNPGFRLTATAGSADGLRALLVDGVELGGRRYALLSELVVAEHGDGEEWSLRAVPTGVGRELEASALRGDAQLQEALAHPNNSPIDARLRLTFTLPGDVVDSNATTVSGGSATWNLNSATAPAELTMRTEVDDFPWSTVALAGGGLVVLLVVIGQIARATRNRRMRGGRPVTVRGGRWADSPPTSTAPSSAPEAPPPLPPQTSGPPGAPDPTRPAD